MYIVVVIVSGLIVDGIAQLDPLTTGNAFVSMNSVQY